MLASIKIYLNNCLHFYLNQFRYQCFFTFQKCNILWSFFYLPHEQHVAYGQPLFPCPSANNYHCFFSDYIYLHLMYSNCIHIKSTSLQISNFFLFLLQLMDKEYCIILFHVTIVRGENLLKMARKLIIHQFIET